MPDHEEFQSQQTHRIIRPHQQIRTIKMCKWVKFYLGFGCFKC
jgi:hypothetical protein